MSNKQGSKQNIPLNVGWLLIWFQHTFIHWMNVFTFTSLSAVIVKIEKNVFEDCYYMRTPWVNAEIWLTSLWGKKGFYAGRHSNCIHHHYQQPSRECTCVYLSHGVCVASGKLWLVSRVWFNWLKSYQLCNI